MAERKIIYAWINDGKVKLQFDIDRDFLAAFKDSIPWQARRWNGKQKKNSQGVWEDVIGGDNTWIIDVSQLHVLEELVANYDYELRLPNSGNVVEGPPPIDVYQQFLYKVKFKDLHKIYRMLALKYHPDSQPDGDAEIFVQIQAGWMLVKALHEKGELP